MPRTATFVLALSLLAATGLWAAVGTAEGSLVVDGQRVEPRHAVAFWAKSTAAWNEGERQLRILLSPEEIEVQGTETAIDQEEALRSRIAGDFARLTLDAGGRLTGVYLYIDDGAQNYGVNEGEARDVELSGEQVSGQVGSNGSISLMDSQMQFEVRFVAMILPERAAGKRLGGGGGAPGAAYVEYVQALRGSDFAVLQRLMPRADADALAETDEDFRGYELESMAEMAPQSMAVGDGELFDGWALLEVAGEDWSGDPVEGLVKMVQDGGGWRFDSEALRYDW